MFSCRAPNLPHDPKEDILFLCTAYAQEVSKIRRHLDKAELQAIFFCTTFFAKLPPNEQRICSIGLLGKQYPSKLLSARPSPSAYEEMRARPKPTQPQLRTMHNQNQRDGARANRTLLLPVPLTSDQRGHGPGSSSNIFVKDTRHSRNRSTSAIPEPSAVALERLRSREDSGNKPAVPSPRPRAIKHTRSPSYPPPRSFPRPSQFDGPSPIPQPAPVMPTAGLRRNAHVRKRSRENAQSHSQSDKPLPPSPMLQSLCHARITSIGHDPTDPLQTPVTEETSSTATFEESSLSNSGDSAVDTSIATSGATSGDTSPTRASTDEPLTPPLSPSRTPRRHTDLKIFIPKSNTPPPTLISRLPTPPYHDPQSQAPGPLQVPSRNVAVTEGRPSHLAQGEAPGLLPTSRPNGLVYEQRKSRPKLRQLQITGYEAFAHGPYSAGLSSTDTMILSTLAPWCVEQDPPEREYITRVHVNGAAEISEPPDVLGLEEDVTPVQTPRVYEGKSEYADVSPLSEGSAVGSGIVSAMSDQSYYGILTEVYGCVDTGVVVDGWLRGG
ncbi:hypothetical protein M011DRAFT_244008 [Sporormia fimetaria CBS 119925]|uniref:Uncharacterized protein n=1 Tax=Sporormia fimetaria CBS 119925 TaxID=1340428 RepID=A0A6A6VK40_9PLEO|nr:hypothetical protein M011DRAFT_244008 [Sporormia fimetaria CBS 119925]